MTHLTAEADAASQPDGATRCYVVDLGTAGGLARDQDEPPIAFNLGDNSSQRAYVDCDPDIANMKSEIVSGCRWPPYAANKFDTTPYCPGPAGFFDKVNPPLPGGPLTMRADADRQLEPGHPGLQRADLQQDE